MIEIKTKVKWTTENIGILARIREKMNERDAEALNDLMGIAFESQFARCSCGKRLIDHMRPDGHYIVLGQRDAAEDASKEK